MKKLLAMLLAVVLTAQLAVPAWATGDEEQPENVPDGYTETDPTENPTPEPTVEPTAEPTVEPTAEPTVEPTVEPTAEPTVEPTAEPTAEPTVEPTEEPTDEPAEEDEPALLAANAVTSGTCGENLTWTFDTTTKTLTISGTGDMENYDSYSYLTCAPWWQTNRTDVKTVVIKPGVTSIGSYAFYECINITSIEIPEGVTSIGGCAFDCCRSLSNITLPESVTSIGSTAFRDCDALKSITIPKYVTSIGDNAFTRCINLKSVHISDITAWCKITFKDSSANPLDAAKNLYLNDELVTELMIPEGITSIGDFVFFCCTSLTSVTIPEGVTSIGSYAFYNNTSLTSVTIPESVTSIGSDAFYNCPLKNVYYSSCSERKWNSITVESYNDPLNKATMHFPEHTWDAGVVTKPASYIENGIKTFTCSVCQETKTEPIPALTATAVISGKCGDDLTYALYEDGTLAITGTGAMYDFRQSGSDDVPWASHRKEIKAVQIGSGATSIGNYAFELCYNLADVTIPASVQSIGRGAFKSTAALTSITIPEGVVSIGDDAFLNCYLTSVTLPSSVTSVGSSAFNGSSSLARLEILGSITSMGMCAFQNCHKLTSVTIAEGTTVIGEAAFSGCDALPEITVPKSVTSIGGRAFQLCAALTGVYISDMAAWCGIQFDDNPLSKAHNLYLNGKLVNDLVIPEGVTSIGKNAFYGCTSLTSVTIPEGVTSIGDWAFCGCTGLTSVTIPESVTSIGYSAFYNCPLKNVYYSSCSETKWNSITVESYNDPLNKATIHFPEHTWDAGVVTKPASYIEDGIKTFTCSVCQETKTEPIPALTATAVISGKCGDDLTYALYEDGTLAITGTGAMYDFYQSGSGDAPWDSHRKEIKAVQIGSGATSIGGRAFSRCFYLADVTIPASVQSIGRGAFEFTTALTSITIPEGVVSIGDDAFQGGSLTSVTLPSSVTSVGSSAFNGCTSLARLEILGSITSMGMCAFQNCHKLTSVTIAEGTTVIGEAAFGGCDALPEITIPKSVTTIGKGAFSYCSSLKGVYISDMAAWCGIQFGYHESSNPLSKAHNLYLNSELVTDLVIPEGVTSIGVYAFCGCTSFASVTIPEGVTSIGNYAFDSCTGLTSVTIPEGVTSIGNFAFSGCSGMLSVTIPASMTSIGSYAFYNCTELTDVTYSGCSEAKWNSISSQSGNDNLKNASVHYSAHQWDEGVITKPATCTTDGVKTYTCTVCETTKTEPVNKLGHLFGEEEVIQPATCTESGVRGARCQHEGCSEIDNRTEIPAAGHQWDDGVITKPATRTEEGEKTFTCTACQTTRTETIPALTPEPGSVDLNDIAKDFDGSSIGMDADGKTIAPDGEGNYPTLTVPEGNTVLLSVSTYNLPEGADPHTRYPVGMAVYKLTNTDGTTTVERISELDNLLRYAGSSIRITGNKGIRMITGISSSLKNALTGGGAAGYTLEEYGTVLCWSSEINGGLSLSDGYARHNYAYSRANGTDPVFRYAGDTIQYTNVLVGFSSEQCVDDIAMRPYITLRDADGNTYTLYGGIVNRSIGYIAYQNRGAFAPGTNAYNYIWDIIHFVYGDAYDEDYKG